MIKSGVSHDAGKTSITIIMIEEEEESNNISSARKRPLSLLTASCSDSSDEEEETDAAANSDSSSSCSAATDDKRRYCFLKRAARQMVMVSFCITCYDRRVEWPWYYELLVCCMLQYVPIDNGVTRYYFISSCK